MAIHAVTISSEQLQEMVQDAVQNVFNTMLATEAIFVSSIVYGDAPRQPVPQPLDTAEEIIAGSIGFAGEANGVVFLYMEAPLSAKLTGKMLGLTPQEVTEEGEETINDVIGELTNMTVGAFKNKLCDMGHNCRLTIPSILKGKSFTVQSSETNGSIIRKFFKFDVEGSPVVVDLLLQVEE